MIDRRCPPIERCGKVSSNYKRKGAGPMDFITSAVTGLSNEADEIRKHNTDRVFVTGTTMV